MPARDPLGQSSELGPKPSIGVFCGQRFGKDVALAETTKQAVSSIATELAELGIRVMCAKVMNAFTPTYQAAGGRLLDVRLCSPNKAYTSTLPVDEPLKYDYKIASDHRQNMVVEQGYLIFDGGLGTYCRVLRSFTGDASSI